MRETIVRLSSLELKNIKNVQNGMVVMPTTFRKKNSADSAEILGIYGQNGSGKTAVIDALYYLQQIMTGSEIAPEFSDYIGVSSDTAEIIADFKIFFDKVIFEVGYHLWLSSEERDVHISRETLSCAKNDQNGRTNKIIFMDYRREDQSHIFKPQKRLYELTGKDKDITMDLIVARKMAEKSNCSYIFGESSREIFFKRENTDFKDYALIIKALFYFAVRDLFVIQNSHSGVISANFLLPMAFRIEKEHLGMKGDFAISLTKPEVLEERGRNILLEIVKQINTVLFTIIPGLTVEVKDYGKQALDSGEDGWKVELMSKRKDRPAIPIRMESEGIIKIISILNALIQAFGNPSICLAIDELDAGIFEYMLGELLDIFSKNAKGQLIFTSHNLRALEMLDKESIMFSTANPDRRYIHMKSVHGTNNLRDLYIRSITLGGQDEIIYEETDSLKIARAFRKAGRGIYNE